MTRRKIPYTDEQLEWVERHREMARSEMAEAFAARFGRTDVTAEHLKALCVRKGWSAGAAGKKRNKGKSGVFTPSQVQWLKDHRTLPRNLVHARFAEAFPDTGITASQVISFRKRAGIKTGRSGQFAKGHEPWTKGRKIGAHPNSAKRQFKPGQKPANALPVGAERIRDDGYVEIKIRRRNPYTGASTWFVLKHKYLWEERNGPVPEGHALKCLSDDKTNCDPSNWEVIPRGLLPRLNGKSGRNYDRAPDEIKPTIMAIAKLEHAARNAGKPESGRETPDKRSS